MIRKQFYNFFNKAVLSILFLILFISISNANPTKYLCNKGMDNLYVTFDKKEKKVIAGYSKPKKYWTEASFIFWISADDTTVHEFTFENSYNRLSGKLKIKSHNLVSSRERWLYYNCLANQ